MITAYPPTNDPVIVDLVAHLNECVRAKFYIELAGTIDGERCGSGFFAKAKTRRAAGAEACAHLKRYPKWETAKVKLSEFYREDPAAASNSSASAGPGASALPASRPSAAS